MAKKVYKIPHGIDVSQLDIPISLRQGSVGLKRPITLRILIIVLFAVIMLLFSGMWMINNDFGIKATAMTLGGLVLLIAFGITPQIHGQPGYKWFVPTVMYWVNTKDRYIKTRSTTSGKDVNNLKWSIPVDSWDEGTGIITYTDGSYGMIFDVIGHGSRALFDEDRERIIDSYERFLREISVGNGVTIIPRQVDQDVSKQVENLEAMRRQADNIEVDELLAKQITTLEAHVAKYFKTTTIRMEMRSQTIDQLNIDIQLLNNEGSNGMFRTIRPIKGRELVKELRLRYSLS